jgi:hypothetical protein
MPYGPLKRAFLGRFGFQSSNGQPEHRRRDQGGDAYTTQQDASGQGWHAAKELGRISEGISAFIRQHSAHHEEAKASEKESSRLAKWTFWLVLFTTVFSVGAAVGTVASAVYAYRTWVQTKSQANAAWEQARIANQTLVDTTRARLKLTTVTGTHVSRGKGTDVAWFHFKPAYKNFGPPPAEDVIFDAHIFVVGAGPSPKQACKTGSGWSTFEPSSNIIFPKNDGGEEWSFQVSLQELGDEARKVSAVQPSGPIYMGVIGCLLYHSGTDRETYVTGFVADIHLDRGRKINPDEYFPLYDVLMEDTGSRDLGFQVKTLSAWAD